MLEISKKDPLVKTAKSCKYSHDSFDSFGRYVATHCSKQQGAVLFMCDKNNVLIKSQTVYDCLECFNYKERS